MRKHYLDNIRWFSVLAVVLYHVFFMFNNISVMAFRTFSDVQYQDGIIYLLYPWIMVILFLIAGMSSRYYLEKHTIKEFISSRTRKLLVPSTIGILLFGWTQGYISMMETDAFTNSPEIMSLPLPARILIMDVSGTSILWFSQMLWLISMLAALIAKLEKGRLYKFTSKAGIITSVLLVIPVFVSANILNMPILSVYRFGLYPFVFFLGYFVFAHDEVIERIAKFRIPLIIASVLLVIPVFVSANILNLPILSVYRFGLYPFVFFLGYFVFAHDEVIERIAKFKIPLLVTAAALGIAYMVLYFGQDAMSEPTMTSIPAVAFCWAMCLALLGSFRAWFNVQTPLASFMTKRSFGIYTFHYLCMSAVALVLVRHTNCPAVPTYILCGIAGLGGAIILTEIVTRIPFVRWCLLGIKKTAKKEA